MNILKSKAKLIRKRFYHRKKIFLKYYFKRSKKSPVFIICSRRTGSNLLLSYLNSSPLVSFAGEILNWDMYYGLRRKFISKRAVLRHIRHSINDCQKTICGAKLLKLRLEVHHLTIADLQTIFPEAKFIILYRKSLFDQYISLQIAETTKQWTWNSGFKLPKEIVIDPPIMQKFSQGTKNFYNNILNSPGIRERSAIISYEELTADPQRIFDQKIFPFLGIPSFGISTQMKKQNTKNPWEIIKNYKDIQWAVNDTAFKQDYLVLTDKTVFSEDSCLNIRGESPSHPILHGELH